MHVRIDSSKSKDGTIRLIPDGPIDSETYTQFKEQVEPIITQGVKFVVLDLSNVNYISSSGLGVLFSLKKKLIDRKGELLFIGVQPQIKKLFEIVRALPHETLFVSTEEADKYLYTMMNAEIDKQNRLKKKP